MQTTTFDTYASVQGLKQSGFTEEQTAAIVGSIAQLSHVGLVTKHDLEKTESVLRGEIRDVETSLRQDIKEVETTLREDIKGVETTLRAECKDLRTEIYQNLGKLQANLLRSMFTSQLAFAGFVVALIKLL